MTTALLEASCICCCNWRGNDEGDDGDDENDDDNKTPCVDTVIRAELSRAELCRARCEPAST